MNYSPIRLLLVIQILFGFSSIGRSDASYSVVKSGKIEIHYPANSDISLFFGGQEAPPQLRGIFAAGRAAETLTRSLVRSEQAKDKYIELAKNFSSIVFPLVDNQNNVYGTAIRFKGHWITNFHVLRFAAEDGKDLYLYVSPQEKYLVTRATLPASNTVDVIDDWSLIRLAEEYSLEFNAPISSPSKFGQYLSIGYPIEGSVDQPRINVDLISQSSKNSEIFFIQRSGQDYGSSGGAIIDVTSRSLIGLSVCISPEKKQIYALKTENLLKKIEELKLINFIPLPKINFLDFEFYFDGKEKDCDPIGGGEHAGDA
ncbi:MAG: trypsin-like peptidase domain-containing protein [Bdellovibrionales bacterium]|nr:trypsin-like peptidase domain-containing protein [Bdellovibrionales bacterium]